MLLNPTMNKEYISVIIPMFNEEKNIAGCVDVLLSQTNQNYHVIFIDDGSTDNTVKALKYLLDKTQQKFSYSIIQQENSGAAKARENAISSCNTEFVMILDCDDLLSADAIEKTLLLISSKSPDIILPNVQVQNSSGEYSEFTYFNNNQEYSGLECLENSLAGWRVHGWMCAKKEIFLKSYSTYKKYNLANANYINNDEIIVRLNFFYAKTVNKSSGTYFYQNNTESTTKRVNQNRHLMCKNAIILCQLFGKDMEEISDKSYKELINVLWGTVKYAKRHKKELPNLYQWKKMIQEVYQFVENNNIQRKLNFKSKLRYLHAKLMFYFI